MNDLYGWPDEFAHVYQAARAATELDQAMIEEACEKALQGGEHGVLVIRSGNAGPVVSAAPDPSVPYGHIHERPDQ